MWNFLTLGYPKLIIYQSLIQSDQNYSGVFLDKAEQIRQVLSIKPPIT